MKPKNQDLHTAGYWKGYAAGLRDGEKRLARALRRWVRTYQGPVSGFFDGIMNLLSSRPKERKK